MTTPRRRIGTVEIWPHAFLSSAIDRGEWSKWRSDRYTLRKRKFWPLHTPENKGLTVTHSGKERSDCYTLRKRKVWSLHIPEKKGLTATHSGKEPLAPLKWKLGGPQPVSNITRRDKSFAPAGIRTPHRPARNSVGTYLFPTGFHFVSHFYLWSVRIASRV